MKKAESQEEKITRLASIEYDAKEKYERLGMTNIHALSKEERKENHIQYRLAKERYMKASSDVSAAMTPAADELNQKLLKQRNMLGSQPFNSSKGLFAIMDGYKNQKLMIKKLDEWTQGEANNN